jgi:hypothetical protein
LEALALESSGVFIRNKGFELHPKLVGWDSSSVICTAELEKPPRLAEGAALEWASQA